MKEITFRPLRKVKKTGKITVASYMQWRKVKTADYEKFNLIVNNEYKSYPKDEYVYDHKGELLFWFNHKDPKSLPRMYTNLQIIANAIEFRGEEWKFSEPITKGFHWSVKGFDCDGVPVFSYYSENYVATYFTNMNEFEPLTVEIVTKWFGWFLWELQNVRLL